MGGDQRLHSLADLIAWVALLGAERGDHVPGPAVIPIRKVGIDGAGVPDEGGVAVRGSHIGIGSLHILKTDILHLSGVATMRTASYLSLPKQSLNYRSTNLEANIKQLGSLT